MDVPALSFDNRNGSHDRAAVVNSRVPLLTVIFGLVWARCDLNPNQEDWSPVRVESSVESGVVVGEKWVRMAVREQSGKRG